MFVKRVRTRLFPVVALVATVFYAFAMILGLASLLLWLIWRP